MIARYEWHPFTISSAPEQSGIIWLHIRSVGTWTNKLYKFFEDRNRKMQKGTQALYLQSNAATYKTNHYSWPHVHLFLVPVHFDVGIMQVQMPMERPQHHDHVQALEQAMATISPGEQDESSLMEIEDETHPLAPVYPITTQGFETQNFAGRDESSESSSSSYEGQNFNHMYAQPVVIDVQDEEEEGKGIEVSM